MPFTCTKCGLTDEHDNFFDAKVLAKYVGRLCKACFSKLRRQWVRDLDTGWNPASDFFGLSEFQHKWREYLYKHDANGLPLAIGDIVVVRASGIVQERCRGKITDEAEWGRWEVKLIDPPDTIAKVYHSLPWVSGQVLERESSA